MLGCLCRLCFLLVFVFSMQSDASVLSSDSATVLQCHVFAGSPPAAADACSGPGAGTERTGTEGHTALVGAWQCPTSYTSHQCDSANSVHSSAGAAGGAKGIPCEQAVYVV